MTILWRTSYVTQNNVDTPKKLGFHLLHLQHHHVWWNPWTWIYARIRQTTHSFWNHVGIIVEPREGEWQLVEATFLRGVRARPWNPGKTDFGVWRLKDKSSDADILAAEWAIAHIGDRYDWMMILKLRVLQLLFGHDSQRLIDAIAQLPDNDPHREICSELAIRAYREPSGIVLCGSWAGPGGVTKSELLEQIV